MSKDLFIGMCKFFNMDFPNNMEYCESSSHVNECNIDCNNIYSVLDDELNACCDYIESSDVYSSENNMHENNIDFCDEYHSSNSSSNDCNMLDDVTDELSRE